VPVVCSLLRTNAVSLRFVEEVDDWLVGVQNELPLITVKLAFKVNHGPERNTTFELRRNPGIPVRD